MSSLTPISTGVPPGRIVAHAHQLRLGGQRFHIKGVSYGPFKPNSRGEPYPEDPILARDFAHIRSLGLNTVRVYDLPSDAVLGEARRQDLRLIAGVPWTHHTDFLAEPESWDEVRRRVREAAEKFGKGDRVSVLLVGNEIEKTLVRWMKPPRVKRAVEELVRIAKAAAPHCLIGYATYPSTEYILPDNADIVAMNVYLEDETTFEKYLLRLQNLSTGKPLILSEFGLDVATHGPAAQAQTWDWLTRTCQRHAIAGTVWFSYTDEWHRGGEEVRGWQFGLVDAQRQPRPVCEAIRRSPPPAAAAAEPVTFSVVVCTYNGSATLRSCLDSLTTLSHPPLEVLIIDDGSTDAVPAIAQTYPQFRYHRQDHAGLSVARNTGAQLAQGQIILYTDDDCVADEDWLAQLSKAFDDPKWVAAGGPNLPPPPRNHTERCVAAAPGGPCHVLLNDQEAEHLPGCNLAIRKHALLAIGGFDPAFRAAGDDVDICWRLRAAGGKLRFTASALVWHHRRFTFSAYLRQQRGYGHAEALLMQKHPERFGTIGGARWRGLIYGDGRGALPPEEGSVYHGPYGTGAFQVIYASASRLAWWDLLAGVVWIALSLLFLALGSSILASILALIALTAAATRAAQHWGSSGLTSWHHALLLWLMCLLQPIVREWARLVGMWKTGARPSFATTLPDIIPPLRPRKTSWRLAELKYWSATGKGREEWLTALRTILAENRHPAREDDGWRWFDIERPPLAWLTVTEYHGGPRQLTRVAILLRLDWKWLGLLAAALAILLAIAWWAALILTGLAAALLLHQRQRGLQLAKAAAERAGLQGMAG